MWEVHVESQKHKLRLEIFRGNPIFKLMGHTEDKKKRKKKNSFQKSQSKIIHIFLLRVIIALCSQILSIKNTWKTSQELAVKVLGEILTLAIIRHISDS